MRQFLSVFAIVLITSAAPAAQDAPSVPVLTLQAALDAALASHPEMAAAEQRLAAARQRPVQERSLPDPMVSAGYNSVGKPFPGAGLGSEPVANIGVMVSQELPYPGKRALRAAVAEREVDAVAVDVDAARVSVAARVKQAYYRLAATYASGDVLTRTRALLETLLKVGETRYGVGQAEQQDVFKAQAELSVLALRLERISQERRAREAELAALMGLPMGTAVGRPEPIALPAPDVSAEALLERARTSAPMLRRDAAMVQRAEAAIAAARADYKPDFAVSGGYYNMGSMPPMYEFRVDVVVPWRKAKRDAAVAERASEAAASRRTVEASTRTLEARVQEDVAMAQTSARLARLYRDALLPQLQLAFESSMSSYQTGRVDFLSVLANVGSVLENEMRYVDEVTAAHLAIARLEEMTGVDIR